MDKTQKTFLGIPLKRIFWLFVYSLVLCLVVGFVVYYVVLANTFNNSTDHKSTPSITTEPTRYFKSVGDSEKESKSFTASGSKSEVTIDLEANLVQILARGDFESLVSEYAFPKKYECFPVGSELYSTTYGPIVEDMAQSACQEEYGPTVSEGVVATMYEIGCYKCGPGLVTKDKLAKILREHSSTYSYALENSGVNGLGSKYYLFKNSFGDYLYFTESAHQGRVYLTFLPIPGGLVDSVDELLLNLQ
jgi:hypothetical protein